jgi:hypothetical protein
VPVFPRDKRGTRLRGAQIKEIARDDDSKKSHHAPGIARSAVQQKSPTKERVRGAGRNASVGLGSSGMIVMVHAAGTLDLFSTIDRTWPVTADPAERTVAVLPLNWAIRKRRTSF